MILQDAFTVESWSLRETHLDLDLLAQTESVFAWLTAMWAGGRIWMRVSQPAVAESTDIER